MPTQSEMLRVMRRRAGLVALGLLIVATMSGCSELAELVNLNEDEGGAYGQIEIYSRTSTSWTDLLPNEINLTETSDSGSGSGIGVGAGSDEVPGLAVTVMTLSDACADVGTTCIPALDSGTSVMLAVATPGGEIGLWVSVGGEVTLESINPTRFRLDNVLMNPSPAPGNPVSGTFKIRGVVGGDG